MSKPFTDFAGKTALVTGGVSGLGLGIAKALAGEGSRVAMSYRNEAHRAEAEAIFRDAGYPEPLFVKLDVASREDWAAARATIEREFGRLHLLVNNAGISIFGPMDEATYADWDWVMGINLGGIVNSLVTFLPHMKGHGERGHVVNVASMAAMLSGPQAGIYTTSKFAVRGLTESLRYSLGPTNLGASLMCPGLVATNAYASAAKRPAEYADSGLGEIPPPMMEKLAEAFAAGMPIDEAGRRTVAALKRGDFWIFTHGEYRQDFDEIHAELMTALPPDDSTPERQEVENNRRRANKLALEAKQTGFAEMVGDA